jgi:hypothetical protein
MKSIQLSDRAYKILNDRAAIWKTTPDQLVRDLIKEHIEETVPIVIE